MIRFTLLTWAFIATSHAAMADANLVPLTGKGSKPADYGYTIRTIEQNKKITIYIELSPDAAKAFGSGELILTKAGNTVVETLVTIVKESGGKGTLKLTIDRAAIDGGELTIWSAPIKDAPIIHNFGGFRLSIAALLAPDSSDRCEVLMQAMDGFHKELPPAQGIDEMNGTGVPDINGVARPDSHLRGIANRLNVSTRAECTILMTYLKDPDPKIRRIAAFAIESVVMAYPDGMVSEDMQNVTSEGHRKMIKTFIAGIEKLPK